MIKAVLFDLDGTLVNSLGDLAASTNYVLRRAGFAPHPTEQYRYFVGDGIPKLIERALPEGVSQETKATCLEEFKAYYAAHFSDTTAAYAGISEMVRLLKDMGMQLAVVSNKADRFALQVVEKIFGRGLFDCVLGKREGIAAKPDPASLLCCMQELGVSPQECLFLGDSGMDMEAAVRAGAVAIGVLWGFRGAEELRQSGARYLLAEPMQIMDVLSDKHSHSSTDINRNSSV